MPDPSKPTVKQQRAIRRAEKVAALNKQIAIQRRNRRVGIAAGIVGAVAVLSLVVGFIVTGAVPKPKPEDITIAGLKDFPGITAVHVDQPVDYQAKYSMNPPAGGDHFAAWLNCGIYDQPQANENAVHSLEHGAVWITYNPDTLTDAQVATLRGKLPRTYSVLSPFPGLPSPVVASAWGVQVQLTGVDDPQLQPFIQKYVKAASAPEPGGSCTGAVDGPGRVS